MTTNIKNNSVYRNEKGQALLFIVVAMTIALSVGIAVTQRTVASLKRTSSTDTSSRVFAAAEGGIEWFLRQPLAVLANLSDGDTTGGAECPTGTTGDPNNPAACVLIYEPQTNETRGMDEIQAKASITVSLFRLNDPDNTDYYWFYLEPGDVKEIQLRDFQTGTTYYNGNLDICWRSLSPAQSSLIYFYTFRSTGVNLKRLLAPTSVIGSITASGTTVASGGRLEFDNCYTTSISGNTISMRLKSLYAPSKVAIFPAIPASFPYQGYQLTSLGQLDSTAEKVTQKKEISAYRSLPYAAGIFDNAIYSELTID